MTDSEGSTSTLQSDILASSVPDEFSNFLTDYIQRSNLQETILGEVETIWVIAYNVQCALYDCLVHCTRVNGIHVYSRQESYTNAVYMYVQCICTNLPV